MTRKKIYLLLAVSIALLLLAYYQATKPITHPNITGAKLILLDVGHRPIAEYTLAGLKDESGLTYVTTDRKEFTLGNQTMRIEYNDGDEKIYDKWP